MFRYLLVDMPSMFNRPFFIPLLTFCLQALAILIPFASSLSERRAFETTSLSCGGIHIHRLHLSVTYGNTPILVYSESLNPQPASAPASVQNPWMGLVDDNVVDKQGHIRWYGTTYRTGDLWTVSPKRLETPADTCLQLVGSFQIGRAHV